MSLSLDFFKAFDTIRYLTLLHKLAELHIPDQIYNWLVDFFDNHFHCTVFRKELSSLLHITANPHTKFEVFNFTHSTDIEGLEKFKVGHVT